MPLVRTLTGPTNIRRRGRGAARPVRTAKRGGVVVKRPLAALAALVALAFAAALVLALNPSPAQAQTSVKLVGNTASSGLTHITGRFDYLQAFTTGSHSDGYVLTSVSVRMHGGSETGPTYKVYILSGSAGNIGSSLGTLTNPGSYPVPAGLAQFDAPAGGIELAAGTTYWVRFDVFADPELTSTTEWLTYETQANGEDDGAAAGWSIGDGSRYKQWDMPTWSTDNTSLVLAIHGYAKSPRRFTHLTNTGSANSGPSASYVAVNATRHPPGIPSVNAGSSVEETAQGALAAVTGVDEGELEHVSTEDVVWNNSSLGCMQRGYAYTPVRIPGREVLFRHDGETQAPVRVPNHNRFALICSGGGGR